MHRGAGRCRLCPLAGRAGTGGAVGRAGDGLLGVEGASLGQIGGRRIGMAFQDPMTSLNAVFRVGDQIAEGIRAHSAVGRREAFDRAVGLLNEVRFRMPPREPGSTRTS